MTIENPAAVGYSAPDAPALPASHKGGGRGLPADATAPYGLDLRSPAFIADPYPVYARLRAEAPVIHQGHRWLVSRYADVATILQSPAFGRAGYDEILLRACGPGPLYESLRHWMLFLDAPDHTRLRGLVMRAFTPRGVERLRGMIRARVDQLLDDFGDEGGGDLVANFAAKRPVLEISAATATLNRSKVDVTLIIMNSGDAVAQAVTIDTKKEATIDGKATNERPPVVLGNIAPGGTATAILTFAGVKAGTRMLQVSVAYTGGTATLSTPVSVP